jgi:tRNA(Arg) A34 adenosine deaminase TadA
MLHGRSLTHLNDDDLLYLRKAFELAGEARRCGRHPFGALIVNDTGEIVVTTLNNSLPPDGGPTQHAELLACEKAAYQLSGAALEKCTLYSSAEPCAMCAGAIYWSGVGRVVYGLSEAKLRAYTGNHPENPTLDLPCRNIFKAGQRPIAVIGPLLEDEALSAHEGFWGH